MASRLHSDEISIDIGLVRKLVNAKFPQHANLPLKRLKASGSTNVHFLLGDELLVRLPRQPGGGASIAKESRWVGEVGKHLPVAVPELVSVAEPGHGYSELWCIVRWQHGEHPQTCLTDVLSPLDRRQLAVELAEVLIAFREVPITVEARSDQQLQGHYRGRALCEYDRQMRKNIEACRSIKDLNLDLDGVLAVWERALELPGASEVYDSQCWFHGDIVSENLLLNDGHLSALLDFGNLGLGDPTVDLHGAWEVLDAPARETLRKRLNVDDAQWLRGRAWALAIAVMTFPYYWTTLPARVANRLDMARAVLVDSE